MRKGLCRAGEAKCSECSNRGSADPMEEEKEKKEQDGDEEEEEILLWELRAHMGPQT